ncbi:hypothetical protein IMCC20628_01535 [Hoeflea sp. IMCC20628]|uniref:hypothetical protein n=1 Tax=Hoeflea sp. IMCC20628 TaxID=1620421 RepID=UPI00063ACD52|nr:hypothetical protein [Hoeflea sp. IMCC20628]AKI00251.1 hypothetical protein IMCC20628_01535 [Hoeflea sp. IMCC20628]
MPSQPSIADFEQLAGSKDLVGYGSLVNRATLRTEIVAAWPARLKGWRRTWRPRPVMEHDSLAIPVPGTALTPSMLTAERAPESFIDGLLVIDFAANLPDIDAREFRYHRRDIALTDLEFISSGSASVSARAPAPDFNLHVYEARPEHPRAEGHSPILRSYLDAVMQGFLREFGAEGVHRFVAETDDFHTEIHEDRHAPLYPRAVTLSPAEIELFELSLGRRGRPSRS